MKRIVVFPDNSFTTEQDMEDAVFHSKDEFHKISEIYGIKERRHGPENGKTKVVEDVKIVMFPSIHYQPKKSKKKKFTPIQTTFKRSSHGSA